MPQVINTASLANAATVNGTPADVAGADWATAEWTINQAHTWTIEFSHDGVTWFTPLAAGGLAIDLTNTSEAAGSKTAVFPCGGVQKVRLSLTNTSGGAAATNVVGYVFTGRRAGPGRS